MIKFRNFLIEVVKIKYNSTTLNRAKNRILDAQYASNKNTSSILQKYKNSLNDKIKAANATKNVKEEVGGTATPANNIGSGNIAGSGGLGGEPGVKRKNKKKLIMGVVKRK